MDRGADHEAGQDLLGVGRGRLTWPLGSVSTFLGGTDAIVDECFLRMMSLTAWTVVSGLPGN